MIFMYFINLKTINLTKLNGIDVKNQNFGEMKKLSFEFIGFVESGILGLAFFELNMTNSTPLLFSLFEQYPKIQPFFSIYYNKYIISFLNLINIKFDYSKEV